MSANSSARLSVIERFAALRAAADPGTVTSSVYAADSASGGYHECAGGRPEAYTFTYESASTLASPFDATPFGTASTCCEGDDQGI